MKSSTSALNAAGRSSIATWPVSAPDDDARIRDQAAELVGVADRHEAVLLAPDDQHRALDVARGGRGSGSRSARPARERSPGLPEPLTCSAISGAGSRSAWCATSDMICRRIRGRRVSVSERVAVQPPAKMQDVLEPLEHAQHRLVALVLVERPAALTSTSRSTRSGNWIATSAPMKPPIELPTITARSMPERVEQLVDDPPVAGDRDLLGRHRRMAEARQVQRDHAVVAGEVRDVLQPVLTRSPTGRG